MEKEIDVVQKEAFEVFKKDMLTIIEKTKIPKN